MNKELKFQTYFELKKEDAPTYIGENFLVAADGLGGSGSNVHEIDRDMYYDLEGELYDAFYGDFKYNKDEFISEEKEYIDELLKYLLDGVNRTSALWASRIVISRFVYAMKYHPHFKGGKYISSDKVREELSEFITKGLWRTKKHFDLQEGKYSSQSMLPTTLAAIIFEDNPQTNSVIAEAVWAGDSRCYAITADGLYQLSMDDEDASGAITNLFMVKEGKQATLNYKRFEIQKPCVLMTVSDGVFDPFSPHDNLGVENTFLNAIKTCSSIDELNQNLYDTFASVRGDDTTIAFLPFGVKSYEELQSFVENATVRNNELVTVYVQNRSKLGAMQLTQDEVVNYIYSRANDKYDKIVGAIVKNYLANEQIVDPVVGSICSTVDFTSLEALAKDRFRSSLESKRQEIVDDILRKKLPEDYDLTKVFVKLPKGFKAYSEAKAKYDAALKGDLGESKALKPYIDEHYESFSFDALLEDEKETAASILSYLDKYSKRLEAIYLRPFDEAEYDPETIAERVLDDYLDGEGDHEYENNYTKIEISRVDKDDDDAALNEVKRLNAKIELWYTVRRYFENCTLLKLEYTKNKKIRLPDDVFKLMTSLGLNADADNEEYVNILNILEFIDFRNKFLAAFVSIVTDFNQTRSSFAKNLKTEILGISYLGASFEKCSVVFTPEYISELEIDTVLAGGEPTKEERAEVIKSAMESDREKYIEIIVNVLGENCTARIKLSVTDWFNESRLSTYYDYLEVFKNYDVYKEIDERIKAREQEYESLTNTQTIAFSEPPIVLVEFTYPDDDTDEADAPSDEDEAECENDEDDCDRDEDDCECDEDDSSDDTEEHNDDVDNDTEDVDSDEESDESDSED